MSQVPHFMSGNIAGTFIYELNEILKSDELVKNGYGTVIEVRLQLSTRLYKARKENTADEFAQIALDLIAIFKELDLSKAIIEKMTFWLKEFRGIAVDRIVTNLLND